VIHVLTATSATKRSTKMTTFTINEQNEIVAFATPEEAAATTATLFHSFSSRQELADLIAAWPPERLAAIWNSLPGVRPVKRFQTGNVAATRIWDRIQGLGEGAQPEPKGPSPKRRPPSRKPTRKPKVAHRPRRARR
jgi:hypothetical protein